MVHLPPTLHGRLYLLSFDRDRHRFEEYGEFFALALRAAMLTDLYLTGHVADEKGRPCVWNEGRPDDPVLATVYDEVGAAGRKGWAALIDMDKTAAPKVVRDQLGAAGWLPCTPRRVLGIIPATRIGLYDVDLVRGLADQVTEALRNAIDGRSADPRLLAVGLLGVLAQMPTVFGFKEGARHRQRLREMTLSAIPPILALHQAILFHLDESISDRTIR